MPNAWHDDDWPWAKRMLKDYKAGRLTKRPKTEERPKLGGGSKLKLGRTVEAIEKGKTGKIRRIVGEKGKEKLTGSEFDAFNRFGDLESEADILWVRLGG